VISAAVPPRRGRRGIVRSRLLAIALALGLPACTATSPGSPAACGLGPGSVIPVGLAQGIPIALVSINGHPASMVLDSGAERSLVSIAAVSRLGLRLDHTRISMTRGIGGGAANFDVRLDGLQLGRLAVPVRSAAMAALQVAPDAGPPPDGLLGGDVLSEFEIDLDLPHRRVTFYRGRLCPGEGPPWPGEAVALPAARSALDRLFIPVTLDGHAMRALLDTGASGSLVDTGAAAAAGLPIAASPADPEATLSGANSSPISARLHRFATLQVGPTTVRGPWLVAMRLPIPPGEPGYNGDLVLGSDYFLTRRVWLSYATGRIFIAQPD